MTTIKTIAVTAIIAVAGTVAAFSGLHLGQSPADASAANQPVKAKTTYSVTLSAKQLAQLMHGQNGSATQRARHHVRHAQRHAANRQGNGTNSYGYSRSYSGSSRSSGSSSHSGGSYNGYRCYNNGGHSGSWGGGSSHSGGGWGGGCW
jgi:hypothetical protein